MSEILKTISLSRNFTQGQSKIEVLRGVDLTLNRGEIVALLGTSGAGKTTLLQAIGMLEGGFGGELLIDGVKAHDLSIAKQTALRLQKIGFVYQFHHLLPDFSALENVMMPGLIAGQNREQARERAEGLLDRLMLSERLDHRPSQLSGGEQQRVAIARALVMKPVLILADEPTGNLDEETASTVFAELMRCIREEDAAALIATHNQTLARLMDRTLRLHDGQINSVP